ncbi:MAG TPA: type IV pilus biogenesis/stability protein PilW, partial [Dokdonella sp.]
MRRDGALLATAFCVAALAGCGIGGGGVKPDSAATQKREAARIHTELGQKYMQQGKFEIALQKLDAALSFDPDYVDAHTVRAVLYEQINDPTQAEQEYRRAAQLKPKGGNELNNYAWFLCRHGHLAEAQDYFQRALADPFYKTPALALTNSGTCLRKAGRNAEAEAALRGALEKDPNETEALFELASVLYEKGEYFKARAFVQRFESLSQPRPDALMLGRNIELKLGNGSAAGDYTRRLLQGFPDSQQARS